MRLSDTWEQNTTCGSLGAVLSLDWSKLFVSCHPACVEATLVWRWCSAGIVALHPAWLGQRDSSDCDGIASVIYLLPIIDTKEKCMMNR